MLVFDLHTRKSGVPIVSRDEIDTIAERLVADFCPDAMRSPMEIDIDRFVVQYLGMKQDFQYLSHCGIYLGMMVFNDTDKIPVYDPDARRAEYISAKAGTVIIDNSLLGNRQEGRYRFTMGHEGGHAVLHHTFFGYDPNQLSLLEPDNTPMIQCRVSSRHIEKKPLTQWADKDWMEWQANRMASAILMPRQMVIDLVQTARQIHPQCDQYQYLTSRVQRVFNVSCSAAQYRLKDLGLIPKNAHIDPGSVEFYMYAAS